MNGQAETPKPSIWSNYIQKMKHIPENQFDHAFSLLMNQNKEVESYSDMINPHTLLGTVDSDTMLRFYQNDILFLSSMFSMGKKSPVVKEIFDMLFNAWIFEVTITRTKGGLERKLQSFPSTSPAMQGFGKAMEEYERQQRAKAEAQQSGGIY